MGILTQKDATIFRNFFKEMARLRGLPVIYKYPIDMKFSNYAEEIPTGFSEDIHIDIIFDENPKTSTLRKYGWVSELPDDKPYMATIPFDVPNLCKGCRIIIPSHFPNEQGRIFVITEISANYEFPDAWTCKLAPVLLDKVKIEEVDYTNTNNNFIKKKPK